MLDQLQNMRRLALGQLELPSQRFFTPTDAFWHFIGIHHQKVELIECGSGTGYVLEEAARRGLRLRGVDLASRLGQSSIVEKLDATQLPWSPTCWPIICRPDHSGWATEVLRKARASHASGWYVGLSRNYTRDLEGLRTQRQVGTFGEDGEKLYWIPPPVIQKQPTRRNRTRKTSLAGADQ